MNPNADENALLLIANAFGDFINMRRWVEWHDENTRKVPYTPGKRSRASSSDPKTWGHFDQCRKSSWGIVFTGDGLGGIDLDACRDVRTGRLTNWANEVIQKFGSYCEVSPSGTGVKIFALGAPSQLACGNVAKMPGDRVEGKRPQIEVYVDKRYFTVTGEKLPDLPTEIRTVPEAWTWLLERLSGLKRTRSSKAEEGRNGALFALGCRLQALGKTDKEVAAAIHAANVDGNVGLHENFADGRLSNREVAGVVRSVLNVPKSQSADDQLARLNAEYCVVQDGGKTRILRFDPQDQLKQGTVVHRRSVPTFLSFGDFHNYFKNEHTFGEDGKPVPLGNWWTSHPERRTYLGLTFRPDLRQAVVDGRLNLWQNWGEEPKPGDWSRLRQHVTEVIAAGDPNAETYILNWLAWTVQHPADRAEVALVLKGGRGVGKGTLGNALVRIFGQHATHISSADHLAGRFNAHLRDVCFLFADEAYWPGDKAAEGNLKRLITEPTLFIEAKGRDGVTVPNMLHVLMASNEDWVVPAGEHERRYAIFQVSEGKRQDKSWFEPLYEQMENGGYAALLYDLLRLDVGGWHPRNIPMTEALRKQQERSIKPLDAWLLKFFEDGLLPEGFGVDHPSRALSRSKPDVDGRNPRNGLYDIAREQTALRHLDEQVLASHLKQWGCTPWRNSQVRGWQFPPLAECRARWEEKYPGWKWQYPELSEWQDDDNTSFNTHPQRKY
ncbi:hypothetical protein IVB41_09150 [Bradyrhizobium sp. 44]|uniref:DUF5906 domain-containing protein n=1 Tax=Bradyrhizobium sp. 44 TaxID=2782675 RepID=UPI001FFC274D|nr:DUF5906 domain-containing protein [Bradyrhizobium sp. 44]MCK1284100.1 hypothetical protein [Bradyrhizobium sp. 44]